MCCYFIETTLNLKLHVMEHESFSKRSFRPSTIQKSNKIIRVKILNGGVAFAFELLQIIVLFICNLASNLRYSQTTTTTRTRYYNLRRKIFFVTKFSLLTSGITITYTFFFYSFLSLIKWQATLAFLTFNEIKLSDYLIMKF